MSKKALLVIDMLKDFINEGGALYCGKDAKKIIPFIRLKIDKFHKANASIIYITDSHNRDDKEFRLFPKHCVAGTKGAGIIDELKTKNMLIAKKKTFDGCYNTSLGKILEKKGIKEVHLVGVCTSICVMETASSLAKRGYKIVVYKNGVADLNEKSHKFALERMKFLYGAEIV